MRLVFVVLFLSACAHSLVDQDVMADGKTWKVYLHQLICEKHECSDKMKSAVTERSKIICNAQPFRVISCNIWPNRYANAKAQCMIRCGEAPASAQVSETADPDFQL
jgi:hypothetical protein